MTTRLLIKGGRVIDPSQRLDGIRNVVIEDGRIFDVTTEAVPSDSTRTIDATGLWVLPGFIDIHTHLRDPGQEYKEDLISGARSGAAGGFTTLCCMPNTTPPIDNRAIVEYVRAKAKTSSCIQIHPFAGVTRGLKGAELTEFGDLKEAGIAGLSDDGNSIMNASLMRRAMEYARTFDLMISVHAEDTHLSSGGAMHEGWVSTRLGLQGIPAAAEDVMILRDIELCRLTGARLHIAHISTAAGVAAVREAKRQGLPVTCEAAPHHFTLTDEAVIGYDTNTKMFPPLRDASHRDAIRAGLADGTVDAIATDHAPHSVLEKDLQYDLALRGTIGLETALPLTLRLVREGVVDLNRAISLLTTGPASLVGLGAGTLARTTAADITLVDPEKEYTLTRNMIQSKSWNTPFLGRRLKGWVRQTLYRGVPIYESPTPAPSDPELAG